MSEIYARAEARGYWLVAELAEVTGLTPGRIRQLLSSGALRGGKVGQVWIVTYAEGVRWLTERYDKSSQDGVD